MMRLMTLTLALAAAIDVSSVSAQNGSRAGSNLPSMTGVVTAVSASSVTLQIGDNAMVFTVDTSTRVSAKGAAQKKNDLVYRGPKKLGDYVKVGDRAAVTFRQSQDALHAVQLRILEK